MASAAAHEREVALEREIAPLQKGLLKAIEEQDAMQSLDILAELAKIKITREALEKTKVGRTVARLLKSENKELASKAKHLIDAWKQIIAKNSHGSSSSSSSGKLTKSSEDVSLTSSTESAGAKSSSSSSSMSSLKKSTESPSPKSPATPKRAKSASTPAPAQRTPSNELTRSGSGTMTDYRLSMGKKFGEYLAKSRKEDQPDPFELGAAIEEELYKWAEGVNDTYKSKLRTLLSNLREDIQQQILESSLSPSLLVRMTSEDLASDELKEWREATMKYLAKHSQAGPGKEEQATTDMFRCGKCGQRKTTYFQLQTRSADEPMTTFITCLHCGNRWKQY